jgi:phosphoribosylglycinamide formyltransferase-1
MLFILNYYAFFCGFKLNVVKKNRDFARIGTNAENIIQYFKKTNTARVIAVFTNNPNAGVINRVQKYDVPLKFSPKHNYLKSKYYKKLKY